MKKRIRKKIAKRNNLKRHEDIFNKLKLAKFSVYDKKYGDGYFIFDFGHCSVCNFKVKEIPGHEFGIWLHENNKYSIFGEHEEFIDKFKPSATKYSYSDVEKFIKEMTKVKNNMDYYFCLSYYDYELKEDNTEKIKDILKKHKENKIEAAKERYNDWKYTFDFLKKGIFEKIPGLLAVGVKDLNIVYKCISSPRLDLTFYVDEDTYDKLMNNDSSIDLDEIVEEMENSRPIEFEWASDYKLYIEAFTKYPFGKGKEYTYIFKREISEK